MGRFRNFRPGIKIAMSLLRPGGGLVGNRNIFLALADDAVDALEKIYRWLALANGHGWQRFLNSVNQVLPKRGDTLGVPLECGEPQEGE